VFLQTQIPHPQLRQLFPVRQLLALPHKQVQAQQLWHTQRQQAMAAQQLRFTQQHLRPAVLQVH
jgi:hypothetical protein